MKSCDSCVSVYHSEEYTYAPPPVFLFAFPWYKFTIMKSGSWLLWVLLLSVVVVCGASAYKYLFAEKYPFIVEAACDPIVQSCYERDCSNPDDCPPNGLSLYRVFELPASEFKNCSDNSCTNICPSESRGCVEIDCDTQSDVACTYQL